MIIVQAIPYSDFKEKIKITKEYEETCYIEDLNDCIYILKDDKRGNKGMKIKCKWCGNILGEIERAEDCAIKMKCQKCGLEKTYDLRNI